MHDPNTVAFKIRSPFQNKIGYRRTLVTIWHKDPERDGTDDSCGWFIRSRHVNQDILQKIRDEYKFNAKYWFDEVGKQHFSTIGILSEMFRIAVFTHHYRKYNSFSSNARKAHRLAAKYMQKNIADIIMFAENATDCGGDRISGKFGYNCRNIETMDSMADMVYTYFLRNIRPWYMHPRWHVNHWRIRIHWPRNHQNHQRKRDAEAARQAFRYRGIAFTESQFRRLAAFANMQGFGVDSLAHGILDATVGEYDRLKSFGIKIDKSYPLEAGPVWGVRFQDEYEAIEDLRTELVQAIISVTEKVKFEAQKSFMDFIYNPWA